MSRQGASGGPQIGCQSQEAAALALARRVVDARPGDVQAAAWAEALVGAARAVDADSSVASLWKEYRELLRVVEGLGVSSSRDEKLARIIALDGGR